MTVLDRRTFFAGSGFAGSGFAGSGFAGSGLAATAFAATAFATALLAGAFLEVAGFGAVRALGACLPAPLVAGAGAFLAGASSPAPPSSRTPPSSREPSSREAPSSPAPPSSRASPVWMASSSSPRPGCCSSPASRARPPSSPPWVRVRLSPSSSQVRPSTWTFPGERAPDCSARSARFRSFRGRSGTVVAGAPVGDACPPRDRPRHRGARRASRRRRRGCGTAWRGTARRRPARPPTPSRPRAPRAARRLRRSHGRRRAEPRPAR